MTGFKKYISVVKTAAGPREMCTLVYSYKPALKSNCEALNTGDGQPSRMRGLTSSLQNASSSRPDIIIGNKILTKDDLGYSSEEAELARGEKIRKKMLKSYISVPIEENGKASTTVQDQPTDRTVARKSWFKKLISRGEDRDNDEVAKSANPVPSIDRITDLAFIKVLGKGSMGKVLLARRRRTTEHYAVKVVQKLKADKSPRDAVIIERDVMIRGNNNPFITSLLSTFQTNERLFFVMEYMPGGSLWFHMSKGAFPESKARFYSAQISLGLMFLHYNGIIFRDLSPGNVLLDKKGNCKLVDFGHSMDEMYPNKQTGAFCGTWPYIAPETFKRNRYDASRDWWSLGVIVYEMLTGSLPYEADTADGMIKLMSKPLQYQSRLSRHCVNFMTELMCINPKKRLGRFVQGEEESAVMKHKFFKSIAWQSLREGKVKPPFVPNDIKKGKYNISDSLEDQPTDLTQISEADLCRINQRRYRHFSAHNKKFRHQ